MREVLWVAAIVTVALLLLRGSRTQSIPDPPSDPQFAEQVIAPSHSVPVVVKFGAKWCGPCRMMEPELDQLEQDLAGQVRVVRVDVDEHRDWADHFEVGGIPDTIVFSEGRGVARDTGLMRATELESWLQPWLR
ncbi:MAG: thioredoxin family protein [Planctomycetaceae bacterium]